MPAGEPVDARPMPAAEPVGAHPMPAAELVGARITYRLRRIVERAGDHDIPLDLVASIDKAIDDLCDLQDNLGASEVLRLTPYFATLWPSARALSRWIVAHAPSLAGRTIVELGSGLALPSLLATRLGAHVLAVDCHPDAAPLLRHNAALSHLTIASDPTDWTRPDAVAELRARVGPIDLVLASDILYDADLMHALPAALHALTDESTRVVLTDPGRPHLQQAVNLIERAGFTSRTDVVRVPSSLDERAIGGAATPPTQDIFVVELTRRSAANR